MEIKMRKHDEKLEQKSTAKTEISGALDDKDLEKVTGGDKTVVQRHEKATGSTGVHENLSLSFAKFNSEYRPE
jgi:hypothetical protein